MNPKRLDFIEEFLELTHLAIEEAAHGLSEAAKTRLANRITEGFLDLWGGTSVYLPKLDSLHRARRDREIARTFDGTVDGVNGIKALASRHGLSTIHVYRLISQHRRNATSTQTQRLQRPITEN